MIKTLLASVSSIALAFLPAEALANKIFWFGYVPPVVVATLCPFGSALPDGCAANQAPSWATTLGAPTVANQSAQYKVSSCLTAFAQNTTPQVLTYNPHNPGPSGNSQSNMAGCDYPVGTITPIGSLCDPATQAATCSAGPMPSQCVYTTGKLTCSSSSAVTTITLTGWDFGPVGGHGCTFVNVVGAHITNLVSHNNHYKNDDNCSAQGITYGLLNFGQTGATVTINALSYNDTFEGDWTNATDCVNSNTCPWANSISAIAYNGSSSGGGNFGAMYDAFIGFTGHGIFLTSPNDAFFAYNLGNGWNNTSANGHGEETLNSGTMGSQEYLYNTFTQPKSGPAAGQTSTFWPGSTNGSYLSGSMQIVGNSFINGNWVGGTQTAPTFTGTIDSGNGQGASDSTGGDVLTVCTSGLNTGIGPFPGLSAAYGTIAGSPGSGNAFIGVQISPPSLPASCSGAGTQWTVVCDNPPNSNCLGPHYGGTNKWKTNVTTANSWNTVWANPVAYSIDHTWFEASPAIVVTGNYVNTLYNDTSHGPWSASGGAMCGTPTAFSGNIDMVSGSAITSYYSSTANGLPLSPTFTANSPTITVSPNAAPVTITTGTPGIIAATNSFGVNQMLKFAGGTLPGGITAGTSYYVTATSLSSSQFTVATWKGQGAITLSGSPTGVTMTGVPPFNGTAVQFTSSGGSTPTGIVSGQTYYLVNRTNTTFQIQTGYPTGSIVTPTDVGSGTITMTWGKC